MTRPRVRSEPPRELPEREALHASREERSREEDGVDDRRGDARAGEQLGLAVEEGEVEARVVRDENCVAGEVEKAPHGLGRTRRAT